MVVGDSTALAFALQVLECRRLPDPSGAKTAVARGEHSCCSWRAGTRHGMLGEMPVALGEASPWPCPPGSQGADAEPWPVTS